MFCEPVHNGGNRLYNLLRDYSLFDTEVGYMQGMNFIAGIVLMIFDEDILAWIVFVKLLKLNNWRTLYTPDMPKFFDLSYKVKL